MNVLITGCTGFIGGGVLARIIDNPKYDKIYVLLRGSKTETPQQRFAELGKDLFPGYKQTLANEKVVAIAGDLVSPGLNISASDRKELVKNVHQIVHIAACTNFADPIDSLRAFNVQGTKKLLELAKECRKNGQFKRFDFVSTAYTAGNKPGTVVETDLDRGQNFTNNYEQSKFETESMVRTYMGDFPITIMRPSIVVGQSDNGFTPHFRVLYWPVKMIARGYATIIPINKKAILDVVPADYVTNAIVALMQSDKAHNRTFLLTAGKGNEVSIPKLLNDAQKMGACKYRLRIPIWAFRVVEHTILRRLLPKSFWELAEKAKPYTGYLEGTDVHYDNSATTELLTELGVKRPHWDAYHQNVFGHAIDRDWGRVAPKEAHNYFHGDQPPVSLEAVRFQKRADAKVALGGAST
jgi:thioester reductase-like protein